MNGRLTPLLIAIILFPILVPAAEDLAVLFPNRASIRTESPGLSRLELPPEVLSACRPDLADLRILSDDGREVPFLVDSPAAPVDLEVVHRTEPEVLSARRTRNAVDDRVTAYREKFVLRLPPLPPGLAAWDLVLDAGSPEFVVEATITGRTTSGETVPILDQGSFFRLPRSAAEKTRITLPRRDLDRIDLTLRGIDQGYLEPRLFLEARRTLPRGTESGVDLETSKMTSADGRTDLTVVRPRGLVPRRLRFRTTTGTFNRPVTVWDEGPDADPQPLAKGVILRIDTIAPVESLEIPIRPPRGDSLRITIDDGDSPPLEDLGLQAVIDRPVLVFSLPSGEAEISLFFGGARAHRPRYDLLRLGGRGDLPAHGKTAERLLAVLDPSLAGVASLGPIEANDRFDPRPALEFAMHPGAPVDAGLYSHRRVLDVSPSPEGLVRIDLGFEDLAIMRPDGADIRIVDDDGKQWAYLTEKRARVIDIPLRPTETRLDDGRSRYRIEVPNPPLRCDRLRVEIAASFFDRAFTLRARLEDGDEKELARGRLVRRPGDPRPLFIAFTPSRIHSLELIVDDGDDAPLPIVSVTARGFAPALYLATRPGRYDLLMGFPEAQTPRYELANIRSTVLAVPSGASTVGPLEPNPKYNAAHRLSGSATARKILLWVVLALAVLVLIVLTIRAARQET